MILLEIVLTENVGENKQTVLTACLPTTVDLSMGTAGALQAKGLARS